MRPDARDAIFALVVILVVIALLALWETI